MATPNSFAPHLRRVSPETIKTLDESCIDDRLQLIRLRTAGGKAGIVRAMHRTLRMQGADVKQGDVAETVLRLNGSTYAHDGTCGFDVTEPELPQLYAKTDPHGLYTAVTSMGMNLPEKTVAWAIDANIQHGKQTDGPQRSIRTTVSAAAQRLNEQGVPVRVGEQSVEGRKHLGHAVLSITDPGVLFDSASAAKAKVYAYPLNAGGISEKYGSVSAVVGADHDLFLANLLTDAAMVAGERLRAPNGQPLEIVTI